MDYEFQDLDDLPVSNDTSALDDLPEAKSDTSDLDSLPVAKPASASPQYGPGSEMEKYKQEQARIRRDADWYNRGIIGEGRKHLGTQEDGSDAFEYDAEHAPAFAPQDEEGKAIHERVKAFKGGNLGHFNRPMKIDYDEKTGKAKGYGTTRSTIVEELDGTWSVIPTIWRDKRDGATLEAVDEQDAREHYREDGGERFGNFKTKEEAESAAKDIHELHQKAYQAKWNQWINEHWDEVDDSVKNAEGVKEAHEAWEKAGKPGIRFTMNVNGEEAGDGATGDLQDSEHRKPMGIFEHGAKSLQAATGREYSEGKAALLNIAPFGRQVEGYESNRHVAALERARSGDYEDKDIEEVAKSLGPSYWEEVRPIYAVNKDDARKFLSGMAESELKEITRNKEGAALDMEARPLSTWGNVVASTIENSGYVNSFIYGSVLIPVAGPSGSMFGAFAKEGAKSGLKWIGQSALKSAAGSVPVSVVGGMERASDLANKTYEIGDNDELRVIDNNYSTLMSAFKGGAGSVVENMVVEGLTDEAINIGLLGAAKLFLRYPGALDMLKGAKRGLIKSGAGRALIKIGQGYNALSQFTQFDSIPNEQFEEILQPIFDDVVGLGKRKGEKTDTFGEYAGKMFTSKNQADIFLGLVGTMLLQGGAAGARVAAHRFSKEGRKEIEDARRARSILIEAKADAKMVNALTDEEAVSTAEAYRAMLQNPRIAEDIAKALSDRRGEIFNQLIGAQESKMNGDLASLGIAPKKFAIPTKAEKNGAVPDFSEQIVINPATGETFQGRMVVDADSGVRIVDNGAGNHENAYTVFDPLTGKSFGVDNLYVAKRAADFLVANQQLYKAQDKIKLDFINGEWQQNYGNVKMFAARTVDEAIDFSKQHGVDVTAQNGFTPNRRGWQLRDGTVVLVRDNIKTPLEVRQLMRHETIGHSDILSEAQWLDAGGEIGELRERNLKKVDASDPDERLRAAKESVANTVQQRMHNPTKGEKLSHAIRNGLRRLGYKLEMNDADLEVEAAKVEKAMRDGKGGSIDFAPILRTAVDVSAAGAKAPKVDAEAMQTKADEKISEKHETGETNETRADETSAQSEEGTHGQPKVGEAGTVETPVPPRAEASDAGVVEKPAKPISERNIVEKLTDQSPVQELPVAEVVNDDKRIPNFKEGANPETGEVEPLTGEPYDLVSNPIVVMEFKDGKKVVVTGRHRLAMYKRAGRETISARVIREADGWTVDDAKAIDAIGNIIDEKGSVKDYVNYFNNAKPTREEAKASGFLDRPKGQRAFGIFEGATEDTKSVIDWNGTGGDGLISVDQAGTIAEAAPKQAGLQRILVKKALDGLRGKKLAVLARSLAEEAKNRKGASNVGVEMQLDLFTSEKDQNLLVLEERRADYRVKKSNEYGRIAEVLRTAIAKGGKLDLNADYAKELGITDPNDKKQLAAARDKAVERANYWENTVRLEDADKTAMDAEINAAADAKAKRLAELKAKREAVKSGKPKVVVPKNATTTPADETKPPAGETKPAADETKRPSGETKKPVSETQKPALGTENAVSETKTGKTEMSKATSKTPSIKMKDEAGEKELDDALDALFDTPELGGVDFQDPSFAPDRKEYRAFDVLLSDDKIVQTHGYTRKQASAYAEKKYPGSRVFEQGGAKNAIISRDERRAADRLQRANQAYPDATRRAGVLFSDSIKNGISLARTVSQMGDAGSKALRGRAIPGRERLAGKTQRAREDGWEYYSDGTVAIPIFDGTPNKASWALLHILTANAAELKDGYEIVDFMRDGDRFYAIANGPKVVVRASPSKEALEKFLSDNGFKKGVKHPTRPITVWTKGDIRVAEEDIHFGKTAEGEYVPLGGVFGSGSPLVMPGVNFDTPEFDQDEFNRRVAATSKVVDVLQKNGYNTFKDLVTVVAERKPEAYRNIKPFLQDIWNAVARARGLKRVDDATAEQIYGIIEAQTKEVEDDGRRIRREVSEGVSSPGGSGAVGLAEGQPASEGGERGSGGALAGGRVRGQDSDARVDGQRSGAVSRQPQGLADQGTSEGVQGGNSSRKAAEGNGSVADSVRPEVGERETGRDSSGDGNNPKLRVKKAAKKAADSTKPNPFRRDFVMTKAVEEAILEKSPINRIRQNVAAIKLIRELAQKDFVATPDEQATLAKYVGWGGLSEMFSWDYDRAWSMERDGAAKSEVERVARKAKYGVAGYEAYKELRQTLNDEEYASARASTTTAFYTPIYFVRVLHDNLRYLGVKGGRFLGPSAGVGNFASAAGEYEKPVNWQFVEKDQVTGMILKALFPNQRVTIGGFEETKFPDGFFDFAIDNVPYADVSITDRSLSPRGFKIHDYFFAKTLAKLRPGGVMAFLTSTGTLDKTSPILRQFLTEHGGKIVGAVRLPNGFFSENAGTDVASDLVIVQKVQGRPDNSAFEKAEKYGTTTEWVRRQGRVEKPLTYNSYFKDHPGQIVGKMEVASGQFGPTLKYTMPEKDMLDSIGGAIARALDGIDRDALLKSATVAAPEERAPVYDDEGLRQGNITLKDGKPYIKSGEMLEPISMPNDRALSKELGKRLRTGKQIVEGLIDLRKAMRGVIDAQMRGIDDEGLKPLLATLNEVYDKFVKKNGTLHDKWVTPFVMLDKADGNRMLALERTVKDENGKSSVVKSDIFSKRVISLGQRATKAGSPKEALIISYSETGGINVPRIASLLDMTGEEAIDALKESGDVFENPQTGLLEPSWEYLSGRVRAKLAAARAAVEAGEESYRANVEALEKVQPPMVKLEDTEIKFGATWVDPECMKDFLRDAFGSEYMRITLNKNELTGQWNVEFDRVMNADPWGETSWGPQEFVSRVLNHGSMEHIVTDPVDKKKYRDERRTEANKLAAEKLHSAFSQFILSSDKWAGPMYERYNAVMTDNVGIKLPNNILPFRAAGMSEETLRMLFEDGDTSRPKKGREYQSDVIARGVLGGSSLCLAHCVGAGKTLEMQAIGMLGRRLGMFKKSMYVVPNHMLDQFVNEFTRAFPNANLLKMTAEDVKPANRRAFFAQVANGDWDAIVVKHSTFSQKLGMSKQYQEDFMIQQKKDLMAAIAAMKESGDRISVKQGEKMLARLEDKLKKLGNAEGKDKEIVPFEELGVDQLFVDEAHNFKGMPITTRQGRTGGLQQGDSQRAEDMHMKTQYVQSLHGGMRGVVFATGTPLSNAPVVEAYVMLKYLAPNKLAEQGLSHFDDFVDAFGRITTETEFREDGKTTKEKDKISAFVNIPDFMKLFRSVVDIVNSDQLDIPRPKPKYHMIDVDMTDAQRVVMEAVAKESSIPAGKEWPIKYMDLTWVAKYACITPKMLGIDELGNKVLRVASEVKQVYDDTAEERGTQLIFTDRFEVGYEKAARRVLGKQSDIVGSRSFNLNNEIKDLLVQSGIPADEIAIIQDIDKSKGDKDANKEALFAKVRNGEVRVLIGSRQKMGEGTNVQERLAAIHLLHPGWKPSEDEQAIGRIIRNGNMFKVGQIFYYLTKGNENIGSYETKNHQLIGVKSKLIDQVMHSDDSVRSVEMDESAMDRDMLMGLASGNKALMELIDVKKRVHKLELNTESTLSSARRNKDKAEANTRVLERRREEFAKEQEGVKEWREKNDGKPFALSTPDGRMIEKVKDMADYVSSQMVRELTKDRYDREEETVLGNFNGVDLALTYDRYGDEKFRLAIPTLGVAREINYSGFLPDFTVGAMTAFKNKVLEAASPEFAKAQEAAFDDLAKQAKKMSADADKLQKDYEQMRDELVKLRRRQAELERTVTPLMVQAVEDRKTAMYGNWFIEKPGKGQLYVAQRESDGKSLSAPTVKELIPLMDAEDFATPRNAATKTPELRNRLKPNSKGETPSVDTLSVGQVDFDTPELSPAEAEYAESEDKTPTEKIMREVFGMTNDEIATAVKAAGMEPVKGVRKSDEQLWKQSETLLSNPSYMVKLSRSAFKFARPLRDYENVALSVLFRERQAKVNKLQQLHDELAEIPEEDMKETPELADELKGVSADLAKARSEMYETATAMQQGASEQGRALRSNRVLLNKYDLSFAGILQMIAEDARGIDKISPEMSKDIKELADRFAELDEQGRELYRAKLKAFSDKTVAQIKNGAKIRRATERKAGDEAKRVTKNYMDALAHIEVGATEVGGTLVGLQDQQYPGWGRWLKWIGEFHCYENPDITEGEVIKAILEDISPFVTADEDAVRDALTGYGHSYKQSRYDSQRLMNDLKAQSLEKVKQREMIEKGTMPLATGMVRDEPSDVLRAERKNTYEMKKEIPDEARDARHLKGLLDSAKTRIKNRIADMERAIETGEKIAARDRTIPEDIELRELKKRKAELQALYDEMFKTERGMTEVQRIAATEKVLARELEVAMEDLARAQSGDFSKRPKRLGVTSPTIDALRDRLNEVRNSILDLKKAKYKYGMTPEEVAALHARKIANREKAIMRLAERILLGDTGTQKKSQPPMPPEMQKMYDEMGRQMKNAHRTLNQMREEARRAAWPKWEQAAAAYFTYFNGMFTAHMASFDRSAVMRQALKLTASHPLWAAVNMGEAEKAAWSESRFQQINADLLADAIIREGMEKYGLKLRSSDIVNVHDVEMFSGVDRQPPKMIRRLNEAIDKIPLLGLAYKGVRKLDRAMLENSERHYVTYLNLMAAQTYKTVLGAIPGATEWQKREVAQIVNMLSGAGAMSEQTRAGLNKLNDKLGHLVWSPNLWASQIQQFFYADVLHPVFASRDGGNGGDYRTKEEMLQVVKEATKMRLRAEFAILAIGAMLAYLWSDDDWWDEYKQAWRERRWWKAVNMTKHPVLGKTHIDLEMGQRTVSRFVSQFVTGEYETSSGRIVKSGDFGSKDLYDMLGRTIGGKLSPTFSTVFELANRKAFTGKPLDWQMFVTGLLPLTPTDVVQSAIEDGWYNGQAPVAIALTLLGAGGNVYDEKYYDRAVNAYKNTELSDVERAAINAADNEVRKIRKAEKDGIAAESDVARREELEESIKTAIKQGQSVSDVSYNAAVAAFKAAKEKYDTIANDQMLLPDAKKSLLEMEVADNPILSARHKVEAWIGRINRDNARMADWRRKGATDEDLKGISSNIEAAKAEVLKLIRESRQKK